MQLLFSLVAVGVVICGVVTESLPWVLIGVGVFAFLSSGRRETAMAEEAQRWLHGIKALLGPLWQQLLLAALVCSSLAGWVFLRDFDSSVSVYPWLVALLMVLAAGLVHDRRLVRNTTASISGRWTRLDWGAVLLLGLVALGLRVYQLGELLPPVHGDEGEMGMLALLALHGPEPDLASRPLAIFGTSFLDHPSLFHYLQAFNMLIFGESMTALRILSAICGALCPPLLYAIGRVGWGRVAGLTAGWLLTVSHLHIHYSRIALNNIETVLFIILFVWLLVLLDATQLRPSRATEVEPEPNLESNPQAAAPQGDARLLVPILAGLVMGLAQYAYYGSRMIPVLAALLLFVLWRQRRITPRQIVAVVAATLVAYLPLAFFYAQDLQSFTNRLEGVSSFTPLGMAQTLGSDAVWPNDLPRLLWTQIKINLRFFLHYGDASSFYLADIPAFDRITVTLFWLGLGTVLARIRRFPELSLVAWFGIGVFLGGVLTTNAPSGTRLLVAVPAVFLISGNFVQKVSDFVTKVWPLTMRWVAPVLLGAFAVSTLWLNFDTYFVQYKTRQPNQVYTLIAQEIAQNADQYQAFLFGAPHIYVNNGIPRFIARDADKYDVEKAEEFGERLAEARSGAVGDETANTASTKGAMLVVLPNHFEDLSQIEGQFPGGKLAEHTTADGRVIYKVYKIPAGGLPK